MKKLYFLLFGCLFSISVIAQIWTPQDVGYGTKTLGMRDLSIVDANTVWITSYDGFYPFVTNRLDFSRTTDGGKTWKAGIMNFDTNYVTSSIIAVSGAEAWTSVYKNAGGGALFYTRDSGVTWLQSGKGLIFDDNSFPDFVHFKDSLNGVAFGDPNNGYFEIYKTTNRGTNWTRINTAQIPLPLTNEYGTIFFTAFKNSLWLCTTNGRVIYSNDFGSTWSASTVYTGNGFFNRIAFRDALNGICIVTNASGSAGVYATSDGGATWVLRPNATNLKPGSLCAIPGTNVYLSCTQGGPKVRGTSISKDDGQTWIELENLNSRNTVAFINSTTGWCGGFSGPGQLGGIFKYNGSPLTTNIKEESTANISVYPNPVSHFLNVDLKDFSTGKLSVTVTNELGQTIFNFNKEHENFSSDFKIDFSKFQEGVYFLTISDEKSSLSRKVIKKE
jgi:photosystem II stability/assembly factor-like uncharacterized protein